MYRVHQAIVSDYARSDPANFGCILNSLIRGASMAQAVGAYEKREEAQTMQEKYSVTIYDGDRKIGAIKALRSITARKDTLGGSGVVNNSNPLGLKEAKDIVESGFNGHFTVVMTKDQVFDFLQVITRDNNEHHIVRHVRITGIAKASNPNDISDL